MISYRDVVDAWDRADPARIHPSREVSEDAYWASGTEQAEGISAALLALGLEPGAKILDFGCGDGRVAIPLAALGWSVVGFDTSTTMRRRLRANDPQRAVQVWRSGVPDHLPTVDAAYCLAVLIHHGHADARRIVGDIANAVRPGGVLMLDWPVSEVPQERATWIEVTTWNPAERANLATELSLTPVAGPWPTWRKEG